MCENERWCYVLLFALVFFSAAALVHGQSTGSELSPPSETPSDTSPSWETLDDLLNQLGSEAQSLSEDSELLKSLLDEARKQLLVLSSKLEESRTAASELSGSLTKSAESLASSAKSLEEAYRRQALEMWVWRGGTIAGLFGMLVVALTR